MITDSAHVFVADSGELRRIYRELKHQGTNLNQIARIYNSRKDTVSELIALQRYYQTMNRIFGELEEALATVPRKGR